MKKKLLVALACIIAMSSTLISTSAAPGDVVYHEDFSKAKTFEDLKWEIVNDFKVNTAVYTIEDGKLLVDNTDATTGKSDDSYALVYDGPEMKELVKGDYTMQYDVEYLVDESGNQDRYVVLLANYDKFNSYHSAHIRVRGTGNNQQRMLGSWATFDQAGNNTYLATTTPTDTDKAMVTKVFGIEYQEKVGALINKKITIKVEMIKAEGPKVYINDILVSVPDGPGAMTNWDLLESTAIGFKPSLRVKAYVDNIIVYEGVGVAPKLSTPTTPTTTAPAPTTTPTTTPTTKPVDKAPDTSADMTVVFAMVAMLSVVAVAVATKKARAK